MRADGSTVCTAQNLPNPFTLAALLRSFFEDTIATSMTLLSGANAGHAFPGWIENQH